MLKQLAHYLKLKQYLALHKYVIHIVNTNKVKEIPTAQNMSSMYAFLGHNLSQS